MASGWDFLLGLFSLRQREKTSRAAPRPSRRPPNRYCIVVGSKAIFAEALTRSEARAQAKRELGIPRKGRLPIGARATLLRR